jgi:hypothetical protein
VEKMLRKAAVLLEAGVLPLGHTREGEVEERERIVLLAVGPVRQDTPVMEERLVAEPALLAQVAVVAVGLVGLFILWGAVV